MNQSQRVRLGQRIADLREDMDHPAFGQRPKTLHQVVQVQAAQIFHGIVKNAAGRVAVIINLNGVGMRELAGQADLRRKLRGRFFQRQQR